MSDRAEELELRWRHARDALLENQHFRNFVLRVALRLQNLRDRCCASPGAYEAYVDAAAGADVSAEITEGYRLAQIDIAPETISDVAGVALKAATEFVQSWPPSGGLQ